MESAATRPSGFTLPPPSREFVIGDGRFAGAACTARTITSVSEVLDYRAAHPDGTSETGYGPQLREFGDSYLLSWNLQRPSVADAAIDEPIPATTEEMLALPIDLVNGWFRMWQREMAGLPDPFVSSPSSDGPPSAAEPPTQTPASRSASRRSSSAPN